MIANDCGFFDVWCEALIESRVDLDRFLEDDERVVLARGGQSRNLRYDL
jgi:hypothetical protein